MKIAAPALALLAGLVQSQAIADLWTGQAHGWLQILSLSVLPLLMTMHGNHPRFARGLALGWLFALAWLAGSFWWLYISMHTYGGMPAVLSALAMLLLAGALGFYYALATGIWCRLQGRLGDQRPVLSALAFACLWLLAELARGQFFTGFPWGAGGYAHVDGGLSGLAPLAGVYGIAFAAAFIAAALAWMLHSRRLSASLLLISAALLATGNLWPQWGWQSKPWNTPMSVSLLQGNIAQDIKFVPGEGIEQALLWYGQQLDASRASLVIAPETAIPLLPQDLPENYWEALSERFGRKQNATAQAALIGIPLGNFHDGFANAVVGLQNGQDQIYRYDKHHLVPFGEFVPPLFRWFVNLMQMPLGDFDHGALPQATFDWQGQRLAPNICYEDLFGEEIARQFSGVSPAPTALINASNIAWFGDSVAIDQHLNISRMRALEFARPVLRATNTGATAIIDHRGQVTAQLPRLTRGVLQGEFQGQSGTTPYAWWVSRLGLWPLWLLALGALFLLLWVSRRQRPYNTKD